MTRPRRYGRAMHRAIVRARLRREVEQAAAATPWIAAGRFNYAEWEAAVARAVAEQPGHETALRYFRDGLASLPPREDT